MTASDSHRSQSAPPWTRLRRAVVAAALLALACGLGAAAMSLIPYRTALSLLGRVIRHADEQHLRPAFYSMLTRSLLGGGIALVGAGAIGLRWPGRIAMEISQRTQDAWLELCGGIRHALAALRRETFSHRIAFLAVVTAGIAIRTWYLFRQPMRFDEAYTYLRHVKVGLLRGLAAEYTPNNHLLNSLFIFISTHLAGSSPPVIRIPAFLAGCATIVVVYFTARLWWGSSAGLIAAALVAANAQLISFSTNARGYAFVGACFLVLAAVALALGQSPDRRGLWALFTVFSIATVWTVPTGVYALAAASGLVLTVAWRAKHRLRSVFPPLAVSLALVVAVSALLYWPVILGSGYDALLSNRWVEPETFAQFIRRLPDALIQLSGDWNSGWASWFTWLVGTAAAVSVVDAAIRRRLDSAVLPVVALVCLAVTAVQRVTPPGRIWLFVLPIYLATAAAGFTILTERLPQSRRSAVGSLAALVLLVIGIAQAASSGVILLFPETGTNNDAPDSAAFMASRIRPRDLLIATLPVSFPVRYYLVRRGVPENLWAVGDRTVDRVIVFVDKDGSGTGPVHLNDAIAQAFEQSYTGLDPKAFARGEVVYESANLEVLAMPRTAD